MTWKDELRKSNDREIVEAWMEETAKKYPPPQNNVLLRTPTGQITDAFEYLYTTGRKQELTDMARQYFDNPSAYANGIIRGQKAYHIAL